MMQPIMISCFDKSTIMATPWAEADYLCYCVDFQHPTGETRDGNIIRVGANMMDWLPPRGEIAFAAFFPPCTDVAVSVARWLRDKGLGKLIGATLICATYCTSTQRTSGCSGRMKLPQKVSMSGQPKPTQPAAAMC